MLCYYQTGELQPYLYFFIKTERDKLQPVIDYPLPILPSTNTNAYMNDDDIAVVRYKVENLSYSEEAILEGRFKYEKTISFTINGFFPAQNIYRFGYVAFKNSQGMTLFANYDFPYQTSYNFDGVSTHYTLTILSNIPLLRTRRYGQMEVRSAIPACGYNIADMQPLRVNVIGNKAYSYDVVRNFELASEYNEASAEVSNTMSFSMPINGLSDFYDCSIDPITYKTVEVEFPDYTIVMRGAVGSYDVENEVVIFRFQSLRNEEIEVL